MADTPSMTGKNVLVRYFANRKPRTSNKASYDTRAAARLWQVSADLVGLTGVASFERTRS